MKFKKTITALCSCLIILNACETEPSFAMMRVVPMTVKSCYATQQQIDDLSRKAMPRLQGKNSPSFSGSFGQVRAAKLMGRPRFDGSLEIANLTMRDISTHVYPLMFQDPNSSDDYDSPVKVYPVIFSGSFADLPLYRDLEFSSTKNFRVAVAYKFLASLPKDFPFDRLNKPTVYKWTFKFRGKDNQIHYYAYIGKTEANRFPTRAFFEEAVLAMQGVFDQNVAFQAVFLEAASGSQDDNSITIEILETLDSPSLSARKQEFDQIQKYVKKSDKKRSRGDKKYPRLVNISGVPASYSEDTLKDLKKLCKFFHYSEYDYLKQLEVIGKPWTRNFQLFFGKKTLNEALDGLRPYDITNFQEGDNIPDSVKLALVSIRRNFDEKIQIPFEQLHFKNESAFHSETSNTPGLTTKMILHDGEGTSSPARLPNPNPDPNQKLKEPTGGSRNKNQSPTRKKDKSPKGGGHANRLEPPK